jgi:hypothetical protein
MVYTIEELSEARRAMASMISKLVKAEAGLAETAQSQRTLAVRRVKALQIAVTLIDRELTGRQD